MSGGLTVWLGPFASTAHVLPGGRHLARTSLSLNAANAFMSRRAAWLATFPALRRPQ